MLDEVGTQEDMPKPFSPGAVVPHNEGWAFTFRDANGNPHRNCDVTYEWAADAKREMRRHVAFVGENEQIKLAFFTGAFAMYKDK